MSMEFEDAKLPTSHIQLGLDSTPVAGPTAPGINEVGRDYTSTSERAAGPSSPMPEDAGAYEHFKLPTESSSPIPPSIPPPKYMDDYSCPSLVFEDVFELCMKYAQSHCCYSTQFVRQMKLTSIDNRCVFHYTLESFGEKRASSDRFRPYKGEPIDGPESENLPDLWNIFVPLPEQLFKDSRTQRDIPHTDFITTCVTCEGLGHIPCQLCSGSGWDHCWICLGSGKNNEGVICRCCSGRGKIWCRICRGSGRVTCNRCEGSGRMKGCKIVIVTWQNHKQDFISETHKLPKDRIHKAKGDTIFMEAENTVLPIVNSSEESVNIHSTRMIESHRTGFFPSEVIRRQKHYLRVIPFTRVRYEWKETIGEFYIYGKDKEVYFEDYPQQSCCLCC